MGMLLLECCQSTFLTEVLLPSQSHVRPKCGLCERSCEWYDKGFVDPLYLHAVTENTLGSCNGDLFVNEKVEQPPAMVDLD